MEAKKYYVYKHTNKTNGKVYIGITSTTPEQRWGKDGCRYKSQIFYRAIDKYGWDGFDHEILYAGLSETQAKVMEISLISYHDSTNYKKGYNVSDGGDTVSEETRRKMSNAMKGKFAGEKNPMYNKHHSEEQKQNLKNGPKILKLA